MSNEMQTKVQANPTQNFTPVQTGLLQRKSALCNTPRLVEDSGRDKEKLTLQRSSVDQAGTTTVPPIVHKALRSPGQPLDPATRAFMEPLFGHDFSKVRVHSTGRGKIQTKLKINKPGDLYEQEADRVAKQVMRMPAVQRQTEEELVQTKPVITPLVQRPSEGEEEEEFFQTKELPGQSPEVNPALSSSIQSLKGGGQPLSENDRTFFEPRFGYDFSKVRVHTDTRAAETTRAVNAQAFTLGKDVMFGAGQYHPSTLEGMSLLAHELVHTIQQNGSKVPLQRKAAVPQRPVSAPVEGRADLGPEVTMDTNRATGKISVYVGETLIVEAQPQIGRAGAVKLNSRWDLSTHRLQVIMTVTPGIDVAIAPRIEKKLKSVVREFNLVITTTRQPPPIVVELDPVEIITPPLEEVPPMTAGEELFTLPPPSPRAEPEQEIWDSIGEWVHGALDIVGVIPVVGEIADGINGFFYFFEGRYGEAAISWIAMIPVIGDFGKLGKWSVKGSIELTEVGLEGAAKRTMKTKKATGATKSSSREYSIVRGDRKGIGKKKKGKKGKKGKWGCQDVRHNVFANPKLKPPRTDCPERVIGSTPYIHHSFNAACNAAKIVAALKLRNLGEGCLKRHGNCNTKCSRK